MRRSLAVIAASVGDGTDYYVTRDGVQVGRSDPHTDPSGYRTLLVWQGIPGESARVRLVHVGLHLRRPKEPSRLSLSEGSGEVEGAGGLHPQNRPEGFPPADPAAGEVDDHKMTAPWRRVDFSPLPF